jgi:hypothetical protein
LDDQAFELLDNVNEAMVLEVCRRLDILCIAGSKIREDPEMNLSVIYNIHGHQKLVVCGLLFCFFCTILGDSRRGETPAVVKVGVKYPKLLLRPGHLTPVT